jgi:hypothetical protein
MGEHLGGRHGDGAQPAAARPERPVAHAQPWTLRPFRRRIVIISFVIIYINKLRDV